MILATLLLSLTPARVERMQPPPVPMAGRHVRYVSTWRTRYAIDNKEVDLEDVRQRIDSLEVVEIKIGGDGWQIRWVIFRSKAAGDE